MFSDSSADDTVSLGGGIAYADIALSRSGDDLLLETGATDKLAFKGWYSGNHSVATLQMVAEAMPGYDPQHHRKVERFDFGAIVEAFDAATAASPTLNRWNAMDSMLAAHLAGSDSEAPGGDLAYYYGRDTVAANDLLGSSQVGMAAQTIRPPELVKDGALRLA